MNTYCRTNFISTFIFIHAFVLFLGARRLLFAESLPREQFYKGQTCLSRYEPACPIPGACLADDNCVFWGSGVFQWHLEPFYDYMNYYEVTLTDNNERIHVKAHPFRLPNATGCKATDIPGHWHYGQWRAAANQSCVFQRFHRLGIKRCLRDKKVLFLGDSYPRQIMLRLINYLRGFEQAVEHYYHMHSSYSFIETVGRGGVVDSDALIPSWDWIAPAVPLRPEEVFRIGFLWGYLSDTDIVEHVRAFAPDVVVTGGFVIANTDNFTLKGFVEAIASLGQSSGKPSRMFTSTMSPGVWSAEVVARYGQNVRTQVAGLRSKYPLVNIQVLPVDRMGETSPFKQNEVEKYPTHYQCSYMPQYERPDMALEGFKAPPSRDCRDLFNFEAVNMMLNAMC